MDGTMAFILILLALALSAALTLFVWALSRRSQKLRRDRLVVERRKAAIIRAIREGLDEPTVWQGPAPPAGDVEPGRPAWSRWGTVLAWLPFMAALVFAGMQSPSRPPPGPVISTPPRPAPAAAAPLAVLSTPAPSLKGTPTTTATPRPAPPPATTTTTNANPGATSTLAAPRAWDPVWTTGPSKSGYSLDTDGTRVVTDASRGVVHALAATNGVTIWTYSVPLYDGGGSESLGAVVIDGDKVFVGGPRETVYALTLSDGRLLWKLSLERNPNVISTLHLSVANGTLLVGASSGLVAAVDAKSGQKRWEFSTQGQVYSAPQYYDGVVLAGAWEIYGLDVRTGALVWQFDPKGRIPTFVLLSGSTLYVASADQTAYALDARTGKLVWRTNMGGQATSLPVIGLNRVFVATKQTIFAMDAGTGRLAWARSADHVWGRQLMLVGRDLVAIGVYAIREPSSKDINIYVLSADTGEISRTLSGPGVEFMKARGEMFLVKTVIGVHLLRNNEVLAPASPPVTSTPGAPAPALRITSPVGVTVPAGRVPVNIEVSNFKIVPIGGANAPGEGHVHYHLDVAIPTTPGQPAVSAPGTYKAVPATTVTWDNVAAGQHSFGVQLVNNNHTPLTPPLTVWATVTVAAATTRTVAATPPQIPANHLGRTNCEVCHAQGVAGAPKWPTPPRTPDHSEFAPPVPNAICQKCHKGP